jgi:uncharacterized protein involved in tellurium resistance
MFELQAKDDQAFLSDFQQLSVVMTWWSPPKPNNIDLDLFAVYEAKDGRRGIVYYKDLGDMNVFPFIKLSGDAGSDDDDDIPPGGAEQEENLVIVRITEMKRVYLCCWDYPKVESGQSGRLSGNSLKVNIMDDKGGSFEVPMVSSQQGNVACIATIDNSSPITTKLLNSSNATVLQGLNPGALMAFLEG